MRTYVRSAAGLIVPATRRAAVAALTVVTSEDFAGGAASLSGVNTNAANGGTAKAMALRCAGGAYSYSRNGSGSAVVSGGFSGGTYYPVICTVDTGLADHQSAAKLSAACASGDYSGVAVRMGTTASGYTGYFLWTDNSTTVTLIRSDGFGTWVSLGTFGTAVNGQKLRLKAAGTTLSVYVDDVFKGSVTDATYGATKTHAGILGRQGSTCKMDDWYIYQT